VRRAFALLLASGVGMPWVNSLYFPPCGGWNAPTCTIGLMTAIHGGWRGVVLLVELPTRQAGLTLIPAVGGRSQYHCRYRLWHRSPVTARNGLAAASGPVGGSVSCSLRWRAGLLAISANAPNVRLAQRRWLLPVFRTCATGRRGWTDTRRCGAYIAGHQRAACSKRLAALTALAWRRSHA